jgi:serine/threonine protein kinase
MFLGTRADKTKVVIKCLQQMEDYDNISLKTQIKSRYVASVCDSFRFQKIVFVIRDYFEIRLLDYIQNRKFNGERLRSQVPENAICKQIAEGIAHLHSKNIGKYGFQ